MSTTISDSLVDGGLGSAGGTVRFTPPVLRDASDASGIIERKVVTAHVDKTTGVFTAELDPGVYDVRVKGDGLPGVPATEARINVPDTGSTLRLWPLIEEYVEQPAAVVNAAVAAKEAAEDARDEAQGLATAQDEAIAALAADTGSETRAALNATYATLKSLARNPDLLIAGTITRDSNGAATSAPVVWPDGSPGTYTATTLSTAFPGAVDAYTITYGSPVTKTFTQPVVTRDASGAVTVCPAITVA